MVLEVLQVLEVLGSEMEVKLVKLVKLEVLGPELEVKLEVNLTKIETIHLHLLVMDWMMDEGEFWVVWILGSLAVVLVVTLVVDYMGGWQLVWLPSHHHHHHHSNHHHIHKDKDSHMDSHTL